MILTKSNIAKTATISMTNADPNQDPSTLVNGDFSSLYTATLDGSVSIQLDFPLQDIGYIALGGTNAAKKTKLDVSYGDLNSYSNFRTSDGKQFVTSDSRNFRVANFYTDTYPLGYRDSEVIVFKVNARTSRITLKITGSGKLGLADIAIGEYYTVPHGGEQGGYSRPWSVPNVKSRTAVGLDMSPVALSYEGRPLSCTLKINNLIMSEFAEYYEWEKFATLNTFYVLEDDDITHSYAGFNLVPDMVKAHNQTRELGNVQLKFSAFAKTREALIV